MLLQIVVAVAFLAPAVAAIYVAIEGWQYNRRPPAVLTTAHLADVLRGQPTAHGHP